MFLVSRFNNFEGCDIMAVFNYNHTIITRNVVIPCETGVFANAKDGRRVIFNNELNKWVIDNNGKTKYVKKHTLKKYYISNRYIDSGKFFFQVYMAKDINKKGLQWNKVYEAAFTPHCTDYEECGEKDLFYWLTGDGSKLINNLFVDCWSDEKCMKNCLKTLWGFKENYAAAMIKGFSFVEIMYDWIFGRLEKAAEYACNLKSQYFGIEIEFTGITRYKAAKTIAAFLNGHIEKYGIKCANYKIIDSKNRTWKIIRDMSINSLNAMGNKASELYKCEFVTPLCGYQDIETIQEIVRQLRYAGMKVNDTCGIHIHVDVDKSNASCIRNIANIMYKYEHVLLSQLKIPAIRINNWCDYIDNSFIEKINESKNADSDFIMSSWYNGNSLRQYYHYDSSRYQALNLHSLWQDKGVEFRLFNSTTHAGKVKAYIQLCLAICNYAKCVNYFAIEDFDEIPSFDDFSSFVYDIGLDGQEFKTARIHILNEGKEKTRTQKRMVA